jgi:ABC-type transport system involved in multi-copper enzyme maturation permease subunit
MTTVETPVEMAEQPVVARTRRGGRLAGRLGRFWAGISAVGIKELRGRMRGRRAFAILTTYLVLLALFAFAIYYYLKQQALTQAISGVDFGGFVGGQVLGNGTALSAGIGHGIFGGLLLLETLLVLVLAPALTTSAISLEREKQTLDMLVTTPLSTLGLVIGKLLSALTYVFLLIVASIPLASLVFVFGGVGPEDLLRAYVFLFALAFGMGAVGLFISALVRRTQTATVVTFVLVLVLSIGTVFAHQFWVMASSQSTTSSGLVLNQRPGRAPEAMLWFNPFVADVDMICATAPDSYHASCSYISGVTGRPYFGSVNYSDPGIIPPLEGPQPQPRIIVEDSAPLPECLPGRSCAGNSTSAADFGIETTPLEAAPGEPSPDATSQALSLGFPRDTFWPKSAAAFIVLGIVLTLLAAQLVSPTRRFRLPRRQRRPPQDLAE